MLSHDLPYFFQLLFNYDGGSRCDHHDHVAALVADRFIIHLYSYLISVFIITQTA